MSEQKKRPKIEPRLPRGFIDLEAQQLSNIEILHRKISHIYQQYGFEALQTPFFEYTDVLGKFLPDQDRPNEGVFSLKDDEDWLSLRYDLTAPLARYVAENFERLPKPYRSFRMGPVFRNEKPGPGRFRQFLQFDADIVGAKSVSADAEICMLAIDSLKSLDFTEGEFIIRINNRKILDALLQDVGLFFPSDPEKFALERLTVLRAMDKWDKFGFEGVAQLLGKGRLDESGDFTKGAGLEEKAIHKILAFLQGSGGDNYQNLDNLGKLVQNNPLGEEGLEELNFIYKLCSGSGYGKFLKIDPSVVRGLDYYTGPVFEAELLSKIKNDKGQEVVFGSVGGGGRYDNLVSRFHREDLPATGFSIGVSRLLTAMESLGKLSQQLALGPVVILLMDRDLPALISYQKMAQQLREAGICAEVYAGSSGMKAQMKYADRRNAPCVIIQGSNEREKGQLEIKDLIQGARLSKEIEDNQTWRESRPAQKTIAEEDLVVEIRALLQQYQK